MKNELAEMCREHLEEEERLLAAALPIVRAVGAAAARGDPAALIALVERQHTFAQLIADVQKRRQTLRETLSRRLGIAAEKVRVARVVRDFPEPDRQGLLDQLARVRGLAEELATLNRRLTTFLRIHLDAYQRLLRDLTGTAAGPGRYGRQGKAETTEYRPLLRIHG